MKEGWEYKTLGEVVSFSRGLTYKKSDEVDYSTNVVLRSTNINVDNNSLNIDELKYLNENIEFEDEKLIRKGSILICMSNGSKKHLGKVALIEHDYKYAFGGFMGLLTPVIKINSKYLYYTLTTPKYKEYIKSLSEGANINNLKIKDIQKYIIPIFPLNEQRRIVSYLDSSFKLIDEIKNKALKSLTEAKALFQSALAEAMEPKEGTLMERIGDVFTTYAGGTPLKSQKDYYEGGEIPWLRSGEVCKKYISETELYITQKGMDNSSAKFYPENTVVVAMYGATAAQVGILKIKATSNQAVCGIIPHKDFIPEYVYYWFLFVQDDLASQAQGGAQPNISQIKIKNVLIPIIKKEEQKQIVSRLDKLSSKVRAIEEKYQKMVEECDALKQAMLRDVFE